jgi:hypothetical protein
MRRRTALSTLAVAPFLRGIAAGSPTTPPKRFVFVVRSNGILPPEIQPKSLGDLVKARANGGLQTRIHDRPLGGLELSKGLQALESLKDRLTIFQGLSGKMCGGSHNAWFGALGAYNSGQGAPPILETVDGALAGALEAPFRHLGFAMEQTGKQVVYPPLSAAGASKPLPYYADPTMAYRDLFGSVLTDAELKAAVEVDKSVLDFMVGDVKRFQKQLTPDEKVKLDHYLDGFEAMRARQTRLASMEKQLKAAAPELGDNYGSEIETERLEAHFELATSALIGGLSQVVSIRADNMNMRLTGLGLGTKTVHQIGHMIEGEKGGGGGAAFEDGKGEFATREMILDYHMKLIAGMAEKLAAVPEGGGSMLDNTVILYLSDHGDRHHSKFFEWPMVALGNIGGAFKAGRYLHYPGYGSAGHRTIANLYLSLLGAAGVKRDTFGHKDMALAASISQTGPLAEWLS